MKRRIIAFFILLVAAGFTVTVVLLKSAWLDEVILNSLKGMARNQLGVSLDIGSFDRNTFLTEIALEDVVLRDIRGETDKIINARRLIVTLDPFAPLRGVLAIKNIRLEGLDLVVVKNLEGRYSVEPLFPFWEREKKPGSASAIPLGIAVGNVTLMDVGLTYTDMQAGIEFELKSVLINIKRGRFDPPDLRNITVSSQEGELAWAAFPEGRRVEIDRFHSSFSLSPNALVVSNFNLSSGPLDIVLSGKMPIKGGELTGSLDLEADLSKFPWLLGGGRGIIKMTGSVSGSLKEPFFTGGLSGVNVALAGRDLGKISADITIDATRGSLKNVVVNYQDQPLVGDMEISFIRGLPFTASLDVLEYPVSSILGEIQARSNLLRGSITARCTLSGFLSPTREGGLMDLELTGKARVPLSEEIERIFDFSVIGSMRERVITIQTMSASSRGLMLEASGQLAREGIDLTFEMTEPDVFGWQDILSVEGLSGELDIKGSLGGDWNLPSGTMDLTWREARVLDYSTDLLTAKIELDKKGISIPLASLKIGSSSVALQGFMPWNRKRDRGWWVVGTSGSDLQDFFTAAGTQMDAAGRITMQVEISGTDRNWIVSGDAIARDGYIFDEEFQEIRVSAKYEGGDLTFNQLDVVKSDVLVRGRGTIKDGRYRFEIISDGPVPLEDIRALEKLKVPLSGGVFIKAVSSGGIDGKDIKASGSLEWDLIFYDGGSWRGGDLSFAINGRDLFAEGNLLEDLFQAEVEVKLGDEFPFSGTIRSSRNVYREDLNNFLGLKIPADFSGQMTVDARAQGILTDINKTMVEGMILAAHLDIKGLKFDTIEETPFNYFSERGITFTRLHLMSGESELSGSLRIGPPGIIEGSVEGEVDIDGFRYLEPTFDTFLGRVGLQLKISGPLDDPEVSGYLDLYEASCVAHLPFPQKISNLAGRIDILKNRMRVGMIRGVSEEGSIEMDGDLVFEGLKPIQGRVTVRADSVLVNFPEGLSSTIRTELAFRFAEGRGDLRGRIRMDEGTFQREIDIDNLLALLRDKNVFTTDEERIQEGKGSWLSLDIEMEMVNPLDVDIKLLRGEATGALRLYGTAARPVMAGRLEMNNGVIIYRSHNFDVTQGSVGFFNPQKIEPNFDFTAKTNVPGFDRDGVVRDYVVELVATGIPSKFKLELYSSPSLNQMDIISLLTWGVVGEEAFGASSNVTAVEATLLLTKELRGKFESEVERIVGFDRFVIDPTAVSSTGVRQPRIQMDKKLSDRLSLTMTTPVIAGEGQEVLLRYRVSDIISLIGEQTSEARFGLDLDFQFEIP